MLPFPGIRQIGLFMAGGLLCSFLTVCMLFPVIYRGTVVGAKLPRFCSRPQFPLRRGLPALLLIGVVAIPGLLMLQGRDEVREFYAVPDILEEDQAEISRILLASPDSRYLLVRGQGIEEMLEAEERLMDAADELAPRGQLIELSGVTRLIPSTATQRQNFALMRDLVEGGYLGAHLDSLGFNSSIQKELLADLPADFQPLGLDALEDITLPVGAGGFLGCEGGECASWVRVSGLNSSQAMAALLSQGSSVILVDPIADINALLARYRVGVAKVLIAGGVIIALLLAVICGWRLALQIMLLPVIACVMSLAVTGYINSSYTIVNLLAMLLIIGVSLDYAIFRVFTAPVDQPATSLAITLSALTSILAFGMLAFSQTPLISAFGQTIAFGLIFTYSLSWVRFDWKT
jgi:predicted exporter